MSQESNVVAEQRFGAAMTSDRREERGELVAADGVEHDPPPGEGWGWGRQGYRAMVIEGRTAFPDRPVEGQHLTAPDVDVAFASTVTGTHQGSSMGHEPTGTSLTLRGMLIGRLSGGTMVQQWGSGVQLGMLAPLGGVQP